MSVRPSLTILWLDDYNAGDPLFVQGVARSLAATSSGRHVLVVHGAVERAARLLESQAVEYEEQDGIVVSSDPRSHAFVERAYREVNKDIVAVTTEFGVPTSGFQGSDRSLIRMTEDGSVEGGARWLESLLLGGVVAVVSALAAGDAGAHSVPVGTAVVALAEGTVRFAPNVCFFRGDRRQLAVEAPENRLQSLQESLDPADRDAVEALLEARIPLFLCTARTVFDTDPGARLPIFAENGAKNAEF